MIDRLLIVGLGSIGRRHAAIARLVLPKVHITALRHRACDDLAGTGVDCCVTSLREALALRPDAAVIASPATRHLDTALPLAAAGVHLLIEKPLAVRSEGLEHLIAEARQRGTVLMTGYNLRFLASLRRFRELLEQGSVGNVLSVRAEIGQYLPTWRPEADYRESVSARAELGGGVLTELSHELDYLRWIFGEVEWVSAVQRKQSSLEIDVPDTAFLTIGFRPLGAERQVIASLNMDLVRQDSTRQCTVIGETGTLQWNAISGTVALLAAASAEWDTVATHPPVRNESYLAEWRHFLDCVESGGRPLVSGEDGAAVVRIIEAAEASSATDRLVRLAHPSAFTGALRS